MIRHPDRFDVYYGMADNRMTMARLDPQSCLRDRRSAESFSSSTARGHNAALIYVIKLGDLQS